MIGKFNTIFALATAAAIAFGGATSVVAATLNVGNVDGKWTGLTSDPNHIPTEVKGLNTSSVSWGTVYSGSKTGKQSGYSFVGAASGQIETDTNFDLGTFTHNNFVINPGTSITGAALGLVVNMMVGGVDRALTTRFNFSHDETLNNGEANGLCKNGGANGSGVNAAGCADRVSILDNASQQDSFEFGGFLYILEITGFTQAGVTFSEFWTAEDQANSAILRARFTLVGPVDPIDPPPSPVPLPAAGWLMLAGLGALAAARARRKS